MAGAGKKTFVQGNVLNASEVNTYLMDQSVMVFASAVARDAALGAGVRSEGMTCYLTDSDQLFVYTGSAWVAFANASDYLTAWKSHVPTWTNLTVGNGTNAFTYQQIGKTVHVRGRFTFGSTTSVAGAISMSLPTTALGVFTGTVTLRAGGTDYAGFFSNSSSTIVISAVGSAGTYVNRVNTSATVPGTWTTSDYINVSFTYEAA